MKDSYDESWKAFCRWLGVRKRTVKRIRETRTGRVTWGVISDLHIPFQDDSAIADAIDWLKGCGVSRLVIAGDFLDCYSLSRFNQYESVPIKQEFIEGRKILDYCSREFSEVYLLSGNHPDREKKYLSSKLPPNLLEWFLEKGILERLCQDMPNVRIASVKAHGATMQWLMQAGKDCVIAHPEVYSKIPLRPAGNFRSWLENWHETVGLDHPRLIIIGHTHQAGVAWIGQSMIVENGCLCKIQGYSLEPRLYDKPQRLACTVFEQSNGVTDVNSVRQFYPLAPN